MSSAAEGMMGKGGGRQKTSPSLRPVKMRIYVMPVYRGAKLVLRIVKQAGPRKGLRKGRVVPSFSRGPFSVSKDDRVLRVYLRWRRLLGIHMP